MTRSAWYIGGVDDDALGPIAIWTDGRFGKPGTKTASGLILLGERWSVVCVVDEAQAGRDAGDVLGVEYLGVPVLATLDEARAVGAHSVLVGVNTMDADTFVPPRLKSFALSAIGAGFNVICGTHAHLEDDEDLTEAAAKAGVRLLDVRSEAPRLSWSPNRQTRATVILTVGTDSAVGKMTTSILMHREAKRRGLRSGFVATGQIAAMCGADAVACADHTYADFIIGSIQDAVVQVAEQGRDLIFVEGQGAILHRAYGGGILNVLFGAGPDAIVMCHNTDRVERAMFPGLRVAPVVDELEVVQDLAQRVGIPAKLAGYSVFGARPFEPPADHPGPVVNMRDASASGVLLDSVLAVTGHAQLFPVP